MHIDLCYQGMVNFNISIRFENIVWSLTRNLLTKMYACLSLTSEERYGKKR